VLSDRHSHAFADADAYPNARLLRLSKYGFEQVTVEQTDHYKVMREFCGDPPGFVEVAIAK
jgi:predicted ATPase